MQIYKKAIYYLIIGFLPLLANFLVLPFFTRYLSKVEYGVLAIISVVQAYLTIIIGLGLTGAFSRFYFEYYKKDKLIKVLLSTVILTVLAVAVIFGLLFYTFGNQIFLFFSKEIDVFSFEKYGFLIWISSVFVILQTIIQIYYRNAEKAKLFGIFSLTCFFLALLGNISGVIIFNMGAYGSVVGKVIGNSLVIVPFILFFLFKNKFKYRLKLLKELFSYSLPLVPYLILGVIMTNIDKQFAEEYLGIETLGLYNIALIIGSVPSIFLTAAQSTFYPSIFKKLKERRVGDNFSSIHIDVKILLIMVVLIIAFINSGIDILVKWFIDEKYADIVYYVPVITLAYCFRAYYIVLIIPIEFEKKSKYLPIITFVGLACALVTGPWLIKNFDIYGLCIMLILIQFTQVIGAVLILKKMKWLKKEIYLQTDFFICIMLLFCFQLLSSKLGAFKESFFFINWIPMLSVFIFLWLRNWSLINNSLIKLINNKMKLFN